MYEHHNQPLISITKFTKRLFQHTLAAALIIIGSLSIGVLGYHIFEGLPWIDSLVNASMILGGMGPVSEIHTVAGKIFASAYALYSGIVFLVAVGVIFVPVYHRFLHRFHLEYEETGS